MHIKNLLQLLWILPCMLLMMACSKDNDPVPDPDPDPRNIPQPPAKGSVADHTVLIYIGGDSNLGRDGFASSDLQEMEEAIKAMDASLYSHNNLLVFYDQYSETLHPQLFRIIKKGELQPSETDPTKKILVITTEQELIMEYPKEITSTEPSIIKEVMQKAFGDYPANSYGFVYWSHGDGWMPGKYENMALRSISPLRWIGVDWNNSSANSSDSFKTGISELADVLNSAPKKLDFLMFDACFVMSVEVAYELKDCADYFIGSPTETPGPGAPYTQVVPMMFASSQAAAKIGEAYFKYYDNKFNPEVTNSNANWTGGVSVTVLDTSKLSELAAITNASLSSASSVSNLRNQVFDYDKRNNGHVGYYDMEGLMEKVLSPSKFDQWKAAYQNTLTFWNTTSKNYSAYAKMFSMEGANGVSHYIPSALGSSATYRDTDYRSTAWYHDAGLSQLGW